MHNVCTGHLVCKQLMILHLSSYSSTQRYTIMFTFHVALNKIAQPEASSVMIVMG